MESRLEQAAACLPISLRQRLEQLGGEQKRCEEELQKAMTRNDTVSRLYEKLYEDNATGNSITKRSRPLACSLHQTVSE